MLFSLSGDGRRNSRLRRRSINPGEQWSLTRAVKWVWPTSSDRSRFTVYFDSVSLRRGRLLPSPSVLLAFTEEWNRRGGEKTMILELLPSSRASTLETNCVCNYSALLHLITELRGNVPGLNFVYIYNTVANLKKSLPSSDQRSITLRKLIER